MNTSRIPLRVAIVAMLLAALSALAAPSPARAAVLPLSNVSDIEAGHSHVCAIVKDGAVACWGLNLWGQLGTGDLRSRTTPTTVAGLTGVTQLALGGSHTCALKSDKTVACWGTNSLGQLGTGEITADPSKTPRAVSGLSNITKISAGPDATCAIDIAEVVRCWGYNNAKILKNSVEAVVSTPTQISGANGAKQIAVGNEHICILLADKTVKCWGSAQFGALGNGNTDKPAGSSVTVSGLSGVTEISSGAWHMCAIKSGVIDDSLYCWGRNTYHQVSTSDGDKTTPVIVANVSPTQIDNANESTCYRDGGVIGCFGSIQGTLPAITNAKDLSANYWGGCAIVGSGAKCWGYGYYGVLGNGSLDATQSATVTQPASPLVSIKPERLLDTRAKGTTVDGAGAGGGKVAARSVTVVKVADRGSLPSGAGKAVLSVRASGASRAGAVTVYACDVDRPIATHVLVPKSAARSNSGLFALSASGEVCVWSRRSVNLEVTVTAYGGSVGGPRTLTPSRILDTRTTGKTIDGVGVGSGKLTPGVRTEFSVSGRAGVSGSAKLVILDVSVTGAAGKGTIIVDGCSGTSNVVHVSFGRNQPATNMVMTTTDDEGFACVTSSVAAHVMVDVLGEFSGSDPLRVATVAPIVDTRLGVSLPGHVNDTDGPIPANTTYEIDLYQRSFANVALARTVAIDLTVFGATKDGTIKAWACGSARPKASLVSFSKGVARSSTLIVEVGDKDKLCIISTAAVQMRAVAFGSYVY